MRCYIVLFFDSKPVHYLIYPTEDADISVLWNEILDSLDRSVFEFDELQVRLNPKFLKKKVDILS